MKFISDLDVSASTPVKYGVEWSLDGGGRFCEWFATEQERKVALDVNEAYNKAHSEEVDAYILQEQIDYMDMISEESSCLTDMEIAMISWYLTLKAEHHTFILADFENFKKEYFLKVGIMNY